MDHICVKFEEAIHIISQKWIGLIIYQLMEGPQRFCIIEEKVGISGRVLSAKLKFLESVALVKRDVYPETPVRIEYSLTEKGRSLGPVLKEIEKWSSEWI
jgi:DNA-binding HxlR family transcriptional regulator